MYLNQAADVLLGGGVIAYPTEGVFGLGCLPDDAAAVWRILAIKRRSPAKGLILIAASRSQLSGWVGTDADIPAHDAKHPVTWIVPAGPLASPLVRGVHETIAVRITAHRTSAALCRAVDSPIVSTSANLAGEKPARNRFVLRRKFAGLVDYIVPGDCGTAAGPSEIRDLVTGAVVRPGKV